MSAALPVIEIRYGNKISSPADVIKAVDEATKKSSLGWVMEALIEKLSPVPEYLAAISAEKVDQKLSQFERGNDNYYFCSLLARARTVPAFHEITKPERLAAFASKLHKKGDAYGYADMLGKIRNVPEYGAALNPEHMKSLLSQSAATGHYGFYYLLEAMLDNPAFTGLIKPAQFEKLAVTFHKAAPPGGFYGLLQQIDDKPKYLAKITPEQVAKTAAHMARINNTGSFSLLAWTLRNEPRLLAGITVEQVAKVAERMCNNNNFGRLCYLLDGLKDNPVYKQTLEEITKPRGIDYVIVKPEQAPVEQMMSIFSVQGGKARVWFEGGSDDRQAPASLAKKWITGLQHFDRQPYELGELGRDVSLEVATQRVGKGLGLLQDAMIELCRRHPDSETLHAQARNLDKIRREFLADTYFPKAAPAA